MGAIPTPESCDAASGKAEKAAKAAARGESGKAKGAAARAAHGKPTR